MEDVTLKSHKIHFAVMALEAGAQKMNISQNAHLMCFTPPTYVNSCMIRVMDCI